ncbi:MAG TPA: AraC family transcriptional regulator [Devosiaceae bacterium]|nr:AraC family transcriptional regulator [Devosiaceae bacterium]
MLAELVTLPPQTRTVAFPRGRLQLHAMPASCGIETVDSPGYSWNGLRRGLTPFAVLQHTLSGEGALSYEGRALAIGPGETMLVTIPHDHRYFLPPGGQWSFFYLVLSGQEVTRLCAEVIATAGPVLRLSPGTLDRLAGCLLALLRNEVVTPGQASAVAYGAVMALVDDLSTAAAPADEKRPYWLARVMTHIEQHLDQPLGIDQLAAVAGLSRAHFVRQFTRLTGTPPSEHVFRMRMARAARLLQSSRLNVLEVALSLGFSDPNYFAKAFRRAFDVSPTEFKRSGLFTAAEGGGAPQ